MTFNTGRTARVFHVTLGSAQDFQSAGLRRLTVNACYWCLGLEAAIDAQSCMDIVGDSPPPRQRLRLRKTRHSATKAQLLQVAASKVVDRSVDPTP
ncbi:MAG: hypothetical protein JSS02_20370 [Planctomycetes bacterium]|nr:hypothetical protein [Planctomycetota bacterium]